MKLKVGLVLAVGLLLFAPAVAAQGTPVIRTIVERADGHPADHVQVIPESGRLNTFIKVALFADDFICLTATPATVSLNLEPYPGHWAGASINPSPPSVEFNVPGAPMPGMDGWTSDPNDDTLYLELFWNEEDRPATGARQTYEITSTISWEPATCSPQPQSDFGSMKITFEMEDKPTEDPNATSGADCETDPFQAACQTQTTEVGGESPGFDAAVLLMAVLGLVFLGRRRRA